MRVAGQWVLIVGIALSLIGLGPLGSVSAAPAQQQGALVAPRFGVNPMGKAQIAATLSWTGPLACPPSGCAGGQYVSLRFFFSPQGLVASTTPNLMVCLYAPANWVDANPNAKIAAPGINSGVTYTADPNTTECDLSANIPGGMKTVIEATANLPVINSDAVDMAFRLAPTASGINGVSAKMLVSVAGAWTAQQSASSSTLQVYNPGTVTTAYVANDAASCAFYQPCYINSGVDLDTGLGTGLKDAVDAAASNIELLGSYTVKGSTVVVNKATSISALGSATLTYNDLKTCGTPMLSLQEAVTLSDLTINDGGCPAPHRDLVEVNSLNGKPVLIQSNTLTGGKTAILIKDTNTGAVTVRFNQLTGNTTSVSYQGNGVSGGPLYVTANNLTAVQCADNGTGAIPSRLANHNFWANGLPNIPATRCAIDANRRLGLPIAAPATGPGVNAVSAMVNATSASVMDGQVQFYHHANQGPDFPIYVVDHGFLNAGGAPFSGGASFNAPMPCSNYWDVFLGEGA
ncbi:MAG TPA: hypothetical protein VF806_08340, partial [Anaerolineaceae bacterium]